MKARHLIALGAAAWFVVAGWGTAYLLDNTANTMAAAVTLNLDFNNQ